MKILKNFILIIYPLLLILLLCGCSRESTNEIQVVAGQNEDTIGVKFNAKHGLSVPAPTAKFIGLEVADVTERKIASVQRFTAIVYRAASEARLASTQPMVASSSLASAMLSASDATLIREGQTVTLEVADIGTLSGRVSTISAKTGKADAQVELLLAIADPQLQLANGMFAKVSLPLGGESEVVSVPRSAILQTTEGHFVYTTSGEHFVRAPIKSSTASLPK